MIKLPAAMIEVNEEMSLVKKAPNDRKTGGGKETLFKEAEVLHDRIP